MKPKKRAWKKILYEAQDYPDNHVDGSFLEELRKNLNVRSYDYPSLVCESTSITQQLSSVGLFVAIFFYMEDGTLSPQVLWLMAFTFTKVGYIANIWLACRHQEPYTAQLLGKHLKTCLLFHGFSAALSPILVSLTETISTDTIYAMTTVMLFGNVLFYDYQSGHEAVPGALSLNAGVFASVCLASRLHSTWHAFTTVTLAFELFALWPVLRTKVKHWHPQAHAVLTFLVTLTCMSCLLSKTVVGAVLYLLVVLFITFLCPLWLLCLQPLKNNIYGPWDEAVIKDNS